MHLALGLLFLSLFSSAGGLAAAGTCTTINTQDIGTVDEQRVREAWLGWYNDYRTGLGLPAYQLDASLNQTAGNWSFYALKRGTIDHRRAWKGAYYDYALIKKWFMNFGVTFANVHGTTFSENIGWNVFRCDKEDCTDDLIASTRSTFDFFLSEKGKKSHPHYSSIINPDFRNMGVGLAVDSKAKKYYVTVHFATDVSLSAPLCTP